MSAMFSHYERGLTYLLKEIKSDHRFYLDVLTLQARLQENMSATRLYGDTESRRAERAEILSELNRITLSILGTPFGNLSQPLVGGKLALDIRQQIAAYLAQDFEQTTRAPAAGLSGITLGEVLSTDGLFLAPVWKWYQTAEANSAHIIDLLVAQMARGETEQYLLLGQAGQGKTTVMKKVYGSLLARFRNDDSEVIPIYFPLRESHFLATFSFGGFWEYLAHRPQNPLPLDYSTFVELSRRTQLILLLDGFDEATEKWTQRAINQYCASDLILSASILSCRTNFYELYLVPSVIEARYDRKVELLAYPFDEAIRRYIEQVTAHRRSTACAQVVMAIEGKSELLDLAQRPLLLNMIIDGFINHPDGAFDELTILNVYESYVQRWLKNEAAKPDSSMTWEQKEDILEQVAWLLYTEANNSVSGSMTFTRGYLLDLLVKWDGMLQEGPLNRIADDICMRTFLIGSYSGVYSFIHYSFAEYFVARRMFSLLLTDLSRTCLALQQFIRPGVADFLTSMLQARNLNVGKKRRLFYHLRDAYLAHPDDDWHSLSIRSQSSHNLAKLGLLEANTFLRTVYHSEKDKWVKRGIAVGLALFANDGSIINKYVEELYSDPEHVSVNLGYNLIYYGDHAFDYDYHDDGDPHCTKTVIALIGHLTSQQYHLMWILEMYTLRCILEDQRRLHLAAQVSRTHWQKLLAFLSYEQTGFDERARDEKAKLATALSAADIG